MAAAGQLSIFRVISRGDLAEVQRRMQADPSVMDERDECGCTPLMWTILKEQPAIALWLIEHRGGHDVNSQDNTGRTAIHYANREGPLEVVQQLVAAGADVAAVTTDRSTALLFAAIDGHADIVAFLLTLSAVREGIDSINTSNYTALSLACFRGYIPIVQLLLDAGANPAIPEGDDSPLNTATATNSHDIVALLRPAIAEPERSRYLHKARCLVDASYEIRKAQNDSVGRTRGEVRRNIISAAPEYLKERVGRGEPLPRVHVNEDEDEDGGDD